MLFRIFLCPRNALHWTDRHHWQAGAGSRESGRGRQAGVAQLAVQRICNPKAVRSSRIAGSIGRLAEWFKALVLKTSDVKASVGSNPTPSSSFCRSVAQFGSALALGASGRRFESCLADQYQGSLTCLYRAYRHNGFPAKSSSRGEPAVWLRRGPVRLRYLRPKTSITATGRPPSG